MKKKYFNKKARKVSKVNLKAKKQLSKRAGGVSGVSIEIENRDSNAIENENLAPKNNKPDSSDI